MNWPLLWVLLLLAAAVVMFLRNRPGMDAVGLLMIAALPFTGVISVPEVLAGFSDPNIVLIALLFVLGEGLVRTGLARATGDWIIRRAAGSETKLLVLLMTSVAAMGSIMSSTAVVAIFIPVVFRICRQSSLPPARWMMPMSFAALISGMLTLVSTAPNLVVNAELVRQGDKGFGFFTVTPIGLVVLVLGLIYMKFAGKWLPVRADSETPSWRRPDFHDWIERYSLAGRERRVRVLPSSPLVGKPLSELQLKHSGIRVLAAERMVERRRALLQPLQDFIPAAGDVLLLDVEPGTDPHLLQTFLVEKLPLEPDHAYLTSFSQDMGMAEAVIPADSAWSGKSVKDARIRTETGLTVIGLRSEASAIGDGLHDKPLKPGDRMLLAGFWNDILRVRQDGRQAVFLELPQEFDEVLPASGKRAIAMVILALVVGAMVIGILPNLQAVLIGCLLMGMFGIIDMKAAYQSINWKVLVLIVGMMPFSIALQKTGGVELASQALLSMTGGGSPRVALAVLFFITMVLGLFISNTATAILMAPVAIAVATELGLSPRPFALIVMIAASTAFMTPVSSPINTLVVSPGNYRFSDFMKVGTPFSLIVMTVTVALVPLLLPP